MYTYIRKAIKEYYVETPDEIAQEYWDGWIGSTYEDFLNGKWVLLSDEQVTFHEEHPNASIKEVLDMQIIPTPTRTLELAKIEKIALIENYNDSGAVNSFTVIKDDTTVIDWLTPEKRSNYRNSIDAAKIVGLENLSLYVGGIQVTLPTLTAELMLALIQLYADQCFMVTEQHKAYVQTMDSIETVDGYNNLIGYPLKLVFTL